MARAYLNLGQVTAAAENVKDAMRWESSPDRLALFTELFPSAPPPEVKAERRRPVKIQASLGDPGGPPPGKRQRRQSYKKNREPVVVVPQPAQTRPPEHKPNYDKFRQKKSERLGHNPLTD